MEQARDFVDECATLHEAVAGLGDADWERATLFKGWSLNDIFVHLHFWNGMADLSLRDPAEFADRVGQTVAGIGRAGIRATENAAVAERGGALRDAWRELYTEMGPRWAALDPRTRVAWVGPDMSVRSSMTARQMETWAHGQAVFDLLGLERAERDRIRNIVVLGVNTFGWSHQVHGLAVPAEMPALHLTAPSGETWRFGEGGDNSITGSAVDFARVVAQTRNVADTGLRVCGPVAEGWMRIAQCFAGGPETPPAPGTRRRGGQ